MVLLATFFKYREHYWGCVTKTTITSLHTFKPFTVKITYVKLKEQISLLGGNLIICTKCQVMDFRALAKIHALQRKHKQKLVKLASDVMK